MEIISQTLQFEDEDLRQLLRSLRTANGIPRIIGGAVRDMLLYQHSQDVDIATTLLPEMVIKYLSSENIKVVPTGIKFGTVTAVIHGKHFEITTLRRDIKCDGRHVVVEFTDNFEEDALRRDFTINALSYCPFEHKIYDYYRGLKDLKSHRVRFIGHPRERILEDYLRILRFFRFSSCYASEIDRDGYEACIALKDHLSRISRERINDEMNKWLTKTDVSDGLQKMYDGGINIFGSLEINIQNLETLHKASHICNIPTKLHTQYAVLFSGDALTLDKDLRKLLFSNNAIREILSIQKCVDNLSFMESWVDHEDIAQRILVALALTQITQGEAKELLDKFNAPPPKLPVSGSDLLAIGLSGVEIGQTLLRMKEEWIKSDCILSKQDLMKMV